MTYVFCLNGIVGYSETTVMLN